jgi:hypothetical protein
MPPPKVSKKRTREEYEDEVEFLRPKKIIKTEEETATLRERRPRLKRSNSIDRGRSPLSIADRLTENTALKKEDMKDFSVIAVFSREAFENFGKTWKVKMNTDSLERATLKSRTEVSIADATALLSLQSRSVLDPDFQAQVQALLEKKTSPHVIAVIEGKQEMASFSLKTQVEGSAIDVPYTRAKYIQGSNSKGASDNKQSMSFYIRDDMKGVYRISEEVVTHKSGKKISAIGVNYSTKDGTQYRSLIVHIPNEFIGNKTKEDDTHASFRSYAEAEKMKTPSVIVTSYFGDTNYSTSKSAYSSPSMGGHLPSGATLHPQSSGAKKETHFMQSVPLSENHSGHSVLQPSTLNYVFIHSDDDNREATDHPSMMQYVGHDKQLVGRGSTISLKLLDFE